MARTTKKPGEVVEGCYRIEIPVVPATGRAELLKVFFCLLFCNNRIPLQFPL